MTFWLGVIIAYIIIMAVGLSLGRYLATRHSDGDGGTPLYVPADWVGPSGGIKKDINVK